MANYDNIAQIGESSNLVKDLSLQKNYGTVYGSNGWTGVGKRNGAYSFDGSTQYINFLDNDVYTLSSGYTFAARINPTA
jgi:hypothetical protein